MSRASSKPKAAADSTTTRPTPPAAEEDDPTAPKHPYDPYDADHINDNALPSRVRYARPSSVLSAAASAGLRGGGVGPKPLLDVVFIATIFMVGALGLYLLVQRYSACERSSRSLPLSHAYVCCTHMCAVVYPLCARPKPALWKSSRSIF
jgi:hypothetical protein